MSFIDSWLTYASLWLHITFSIVPESPCKLNRSLHIVPGSEESLVIHPAALFNTAAQDRTGIGSVGSEINDKTLNREM